MCEHKTMHTFLLIVGIEMSNLREQSGAHWEEARRSTCPGSTELDACEVTAAPFHLDVTLFSF